MTAGGTWTAQVNVSNGLDTATDVTLSVLLPAGVAWQSTTAPAGWTCTTSSGIVNCERTRLRVAPARHLRLQGRWRCSVADGSALGVSAVVGSATSETETGNNTASASVERSRILRPRLRGAAPSRSQLRLPLHQFVPVNVTYTATDACGPVTTSLTVTSDEPVTGPGQGLAGLTSPDWIVIDEHWVLLRAERTPRGDGRSIHDHDPRSRRRRGRGDAGRDGDRPPVTTKARRF